MADRTRRRTVNQALAIQRALARTPSTHASTIHGRTSTALSDTSDGPVVGLITPANGATAATGFTMAPRFGLEMNVANVRAGMATDRLSAEQQSAYRVYERS